MWIVVAIVVVILLGFATSVEASSVHIDPKTLPPATGPIQTFALAIARAEGFGIPGAIPTRANNPGDLARGGTTLEEGITVFATPGDGWSALFHQLEIIRDNRSNVYGPHMTLSEMGARWAPSDGETWAENVADALGVPVTTQIRVLLS